MQHVAEDVCPGDPGLRLVVPVVLLLQISATAGVPTISAPLTVVLVCNAIKDAVEDTQRHKSDDLENAQAGSQKDPGRLQPLLSMVAGWGPSLTCDEVTTRWLSSF